MNFFSSDKAGLRKEALARRASILESTASNYAQNLDQLPLYVSSYLNHIRPAVLALYMPFRGELDPLPSIALWLHQNPDSCTVLCVPRVVGDDLYFYRLKPRFFVDPRCQSEFCDPGFAGILEPKTSLEKVAVQDIDCFLIPGVAFDERGYRLGYGRGFYDRALADAKPRARKVGISYDELVVTELIHEDHDIQMNAILTPSRCLSVTDLAS